MKALFSRSIRRIRSLYDGHRGGFWVGIVGACLIVLQFGRPDADERRIIFRREPGLDFKGAEILGNPRQAILRGQESLLSRNQKSVLEAENQLKNDVFNLRIEVERLKGQVVPSPVPSSSPSPSASLSVAEVYGPEPLPSLVPGQQPSPVPTLGPATVAAPPIEANDVLKTTQAGPARSPFGWSGEQPQKRGRLGVNMLSFPVKSTGKVFLKKPGIVLPSGSYVKAALLTGVEAPEGKTYPVLLQLDFAYVIPNEKRLDLSGCFMIAKAQGDLSTERVQMQATKLSCVSKQGGMFEREVNGFVADDTDNSFAVMGRVNSKQDRVAATAFLSSVVSGISKSIQQSQMTSQVTPLGGSQSILTGDQGKYLAAGGASEAASMVTQWYLKQAQNLLPTINIGSGQAVWIVMQDQVDLPKDYFTHNSIGGEKNASLYSEFTRVLD